MRLILWLYIVYITLQYLSIIIIVWYEGRGEFFNTESTEGAKIERIWIRAYSIAKAILYDGLAPGAEAHGAVLYIKGLA